MINLLNRVIKLNINKLKIMTGINISSIVVLIGFCMIIGHCRLPIQAHSFNDLNYLENIINKGIDYFKLDVSMANQQSCQRHSTWMSNRLCLNTNQYTQPICCLGFRGDASSRPDFSYDFNTTQQFLGLLQRVTQNLEEDRRLLFAINFQYSFSFQDFLTEEFMSELVNLMSKYPNKLLIGSGSDFILQYDKICARNDTQCNPTRRAIAESAIFLQTGSDNPQSPRFKNFNVQFKSIDSYCQKGFPKWINKYPQFPLIFWEPSDQSQIQYVFNKFLDPNCLKKHNRTIQGMAVATNLDIQMFEMYMKKTISVFDQPGSKWDTVNNKGWVEGLVNMKLTKILLNGQQVIYAAAKNSTSNLAVLLKLLYSPSEKTGSIIAHKQIRTITAEQDLQNILCSTEHIYVTINSYEQESSSIYLFDMNLNYIKGRTLNGSTIHGSSLSDDSSQLILAYSYHNVPKKYLIERTSDLENYNAYAQIESVLDISSMVLRKDQFILAGWEQLENKGSISKLLIINKAGKLIKDQIMLSRGKNPRINLVDPNSNTIKIVISDSMCHCGILMNNNDMNKCTFHQQPEFHSIANVKGLISLIQANIDDLIDNTQLINPCHSKIKYAKIANGLNPSLVTIYQNDVLSIDYVAVEKQDLIGAIFCGGSNYERRFTTSGSSIINISTQQTALAQNKNLIEEQ